MHTYIHTYTQIGDEIVEVDGSQVTEENIAALVTGSDTPNQLVKLKVNFACVYTLMYVHLYTLIYVLAYTLTYVQRFNTPNQLVKLKVNFACVYTIICIHTYNHGSDTPNQLVKLKVKFACMYTVIYVHAYTLTYMHVSYAPN